MNIYFPFVQCLPLLGNALVQVAYTHTLRSFARGGLLSQTGLVIVPHLPDTVIGLGLGN